MMRELILNTQLSQRFNRETLARTVGACIMPLIILGLSVVFGVLEPRFFTGQNLGNILVQSSFLIVLAVGQMFSLIVRGFDLSVGQLISMVSVASALVMAHLASTMPEAPFLAVAVGLGAGLAIGVAAGLINGLNIAVLEVHPFVATLGMLGICQGIASTISGGFPVFDVPDVLARAFLHNRIFGIPLPVATAILVCVVAAFVLNRTVFGRMLYLVGSNPRASVTAGIPAKRVLVGAFVTCSLITAIAALMLTARTGSGEPLMGGGLMLQSIAAAVIGGVSLRGGEGRVLHCVIGGIFITMLSNGMNMVRVEGYFQMIVLGVVVITGVFLDRLRKR
ncbi:ABC transporter permease [Ruegeria sp. 2012CJ41-6]|uniref:ABC transporter permease n=1 Tax=Ruegeria spongiae TaxID=2942209 RepID=A0ABT0Q2V2_9RHOB|nr:ABC transporter permease [Ruegeria spongiae]MCL6284160.1 ABC transporter permease [Ruegeria spongiae]